MDSFDIECLLIVVDRLVRQYTNMVTNIKLAIAQGRLIQFLVSQPEIGARIIHWNQEAIYVAIGARY
jgi:hypothetical protein